MIGLEEERGKLRVRFAPSPTGYLHVGSLRTALYNYLYARRYGGKFILRIEDTDRSRYVKNAVENLLEVLEKFGIKYDEGPGKEFGHPSFYQSERTNIYSEYVKKLIKSGAAYYCFCSPEELDVMRKEQVEAGVMAKYDGRCKNLPDQEIEHRLEKKQSYVIRLKTPGEGEVCFSDLIRGEIRVPWEQIDDQVLVKSDGYPTYHLANVVDDHLMGITHVIRGEEWLISTPKHILLYEYFGWKPPETAHLPLLLNPDRSKLSKRQGDVAVEDYLKKGYLPEAIINFVALLGWHPSDDREFYTLHELEEIFSIERITKAGSIFDKAKLDWMNGWYIRNLDIEYIAKLARNYFDSANIDISDHKKYLNVISVARDYVTTLEQFPIQASVYYEDLKFNEEDKELLYLSDSQAAFKYLVEELKKTNKFDQDQISAMVKEGMKKLNLKGKNFYFPLRLALFGKCHGPDIPTLVKALGLDESIKRLSNVIKKSI